MIDGVKSSVLRVDGVEDCGELLRGATEAHLPADHLEVLQTLLCVPRIDVVVQGVDLGEVLANFENKRLTQRSNERCKHNWGQALGNALLVGAIDNRRHLGIILL
jgi:hypothetical protein